MNDFSGLDLIEPLRRALHAEGYSAPTPIQAEAIPHLLNSRDLLGVAQTGTGKTAAFVLPMLQLLNTNEHGRPAAGRPRALVLAPTRELAAQIGESVRAYGKFINVTSTTIFGGVSMGKQIQALRRGVDIVVATPGRLLDLINQGALHLNDVGFFVLDEADRMLDMGFVKDVRKITAMVNENRQTLLFSATMPPAVAKLAEGLLSDPIRVEVAAQSTTAERIHQRVLFVEKAKKRDLLTKLLSDNNILRALVFTRTKHGADRVAKHLAKAKIQAGVIHGNKSQGARQKALEGFKNGQLRILVATDIAARGIDVDNVSHVINFDLPNEPETYVHRIGRTARAGALGQAISFCDHDERAYLANIEKTTRQKLEVDNSHVFHATEIADAIPSRVKVSSYNPDNKSRQRRGGRSGGSRRRQQGAKTGNTGHPQNRKRKAA